jgi:myb proto-oncogene protein
MMLAFAVGAKSEYEWANDLDSDLLAMAGRSRTRSEWEDYLSTSAGDWAKLRGLVSIARNVGGTPKSKWSPYEDHLLEETVRRVGADNWTRVAVCVPGRTGKQCRERWIGHVCPAVAQGAWTAEEDAILVAKQAEFGNQWVKLKPFLPGRSTIAIKNRWSWLRRRDVPNHSDEFFEIVKMHEDQTKEVQLTPLPSLYIGPALPQFGGELLTPTDAFPTSC